MPTPKRTSAKKHPEPRAELRWKGDKLGPLSVSDCQDLLGWSIEAEGEDWKHDFTLKDLYGRKVRLLNNPANRPFKLPLANRYSNEHLRGKWSLNLESMVIDWNGNVLQGQHRLTGLVLAEQLRQLNPSRWGATPLTFESLVGFGASPEPQNANTYDMGASRSLGDVIYRHQPFNKKTTDKEQRKISRLLSGAIRLVWLRVGGKQVSFAPHFPHSEALEFYSQHPKILRAVTDIVKLDEGEEGNEHRLSSLLSLSYAGGLHYLMTRSQSWDLSLEFWSALASGEGLKKGNAALTLRQSLTRMDATSGSKRDTIIGTVIKAWHAWVNKEETTSVTIKMKHKKDEEGNFTLAEFPRIGGIDDEVDVEVEISQHQLLVLKVLKESRKELSYTDIKAQTGLQVGTLSKAIIAKTKQGAENPHSLQTRGLVTVTQIEPQEEHKGPVPVVFSLSAKGRKMVA